MDTDNSQNNALKFKARVLEIQNQTNAQLRDAQIIQHLAALVVGDPVNDLGVHNNRSENNQVRRKFTNDDTAK